MPKVSVIIPTYNREKYIKEAVDSVLSQTFQDFEIIVVDDGSTDNTRQMLKSYREKIICIYQSNQGVSAARNTGIKASKGGYIAFLDSDDIWLREKLELQVKLLNTKSDIGMVYSNVYSFVESSEGSQDYFKIVRPYSGSIFKQLFLENFIPGITPMVRKDCFNKTELFDETLVFSEDYDMWIRIARYFKIDFINKPLAKFRIHKNRTTAIVGDIKQYSNKIKALNKTLHVCPFLRNELGILANKRMASLYFSLGCNFFEKNDYSNARDNLFYSIKLYPYALKKYIFLLFTILPPALNERYKNKLMLLHEAQHS